MVGADERDTHPDTLDRRWIRVALGTALGAPAVTVVGGPPDRHAVQGAEFVVFHDQSLRRVRYTLCREREAFLKLERVGHGSSFLLGAEMSVRRLAVF